MFRHWQRWKGPCGRSDGAAGKRVTRHNAKYSGECEQLLCGMVQMLTLLQTMLRGGRRQPRRGFLLFSSSPRLHDVARMTEVTAGVVNETLILFCGLRGAQSEQRWCSSPAGRAWCKWRGRQAVTSACGFLQREAGKQRFDGFDEFDGAGRYVTAMRYCCECAANGSELWRASDEGRSGSGQQRMKVRGEKGARWSAAQATSVQGAGCSVMHRPQRAREGTMVQIDLVGRRRSGKARY